MRRHHTFPLTLRGRANARSGPPPTGFASSGGRTLTRFPTRCAFWTTWKRGQGRRSGNRSANGEETGGCPLLVGAATLESGIAWLEDRTGVRAAVGGSHPGLGTWNALASLGPRQYIEIIAPDPAQERVETFYVPGLRDFPSPRIAAWSIAADDLAGIVDRAPAAGLQCGPARAGSRIRPDGQQLAWTLAFPRSTTEGNFGGTLPFLIEWKKSSAHPAETAPPGLRLAAFSITHPSAERLRHALRVLNVESPVQDGSIVSINVEVESPRGRIVL